MDSASYHSVKKYNIPVMSWKKQDIIKWLEHKGEIIKQPMVKAQLLEKVNILKPQHDRFAIHEWARVRNKIVLRLPPHHRELNPIELAWSSVHHYVRMNYNSTFKLNYVHLVKQGVEQVTAEMWTKFIGQVIKEENKF